MADHHSTYIESTQIWTSSSESLLKRVPGPMDAAHYIQYLWSAPFRLLNPNHPGPLRPEHVLPTFVQLHRNWPRPILQEALLYTNN